MSTAELRRKVKKTVDTLSGSKLKTVAQLVDHLSTEDDATEELLRIPGMERSIRRGLKDIKEGRVVNWRDIRKDV